MEDIFNFETRYRPTASDVNILSFTTTDGTEWTMTEEWLTTKRRKGTYLQRFIFRKENYYDRHYLIKMDISSCRNFTSGKINVVTRSKPVLTRVILTLEKYKAFQYHYSMSISENGEIIPDRLEKDTFRCKVTITRSYVLKGDSDCTCVPKRDRILTFSDQIHSLLESGDFSDIVLTNGHIQIKAHRNILCARSPYFSAMFSHGMKENIHGIILLEGMDSHVMKAFLEYIYSGMLRGLDIYMAHDLYEIAEKYGFDELKRNCFNIIATCLSVENVTNIALLAYKLDDKDLKELSLECILAHKEIFVSSTGWLNVKKNFPQLRDEIDARLINTEEVLAPIHVDRL